MQKTRNILKSAVLCLAALLCSGAVEAQEKRVAILEPTGNAAVTTMNKMLVRGVVKEIIVITKIYKSVARNDDSIDAMLQEQKFQRGDLSDASKAKRLGQMLGADLICSLKLHTEKDEILIDCDIVDVQSGKNLNAGIVHLEKYSNAAIKAALEPKIYQMLGIKVAPTSQAVAQQTSTQQTQAAAPKPTGIVAEILGGKKRNLQFGPYKWRVLYVEGNRALLITEDVVGSRVFHSSGSATWETCDLRNYLNDNYLFLQKFSQSEQRLIAETTIKNPGNQTTDKIFLLSIEEAHRYFDSYSDRKASNWRWLRSPGLYSYYAAYVSAGGSIDTSGGSVDSVDTYGGLRPALWLNL